MKNPCRFLLIALFVLLPALVCHADGKILENREIRKAPEWVADEVIVKFKKDVREDTIRRHNARMATTPRARSQRGRHFRMKIPAGRSVGEIVAAYRNNPDVEFAEPNFIAHAFTTPNDPDYPLQWNFDNPDYGGINLPSAWSVTDGDPSVIVAVLDSGVAYEDYSETITIRRRFTREMNYVKASDLADTVFVPGYDFINDDTHANDDNGHGTHVTGTIAQSTNNGLGVAGIAPRTAIMPVKVLDRRGSGTYAGIAEGVYFAADNGAKIINMSLGGSTGSSALEEALAYAYAKGVTIICASGNNGYANIVSYPAAYDAYCIAVGATRYDEQVTSYSNGGPSLDITAPGGDMGVDQNGDGFDDGILQQTFDGDPSVLDYWYLQGTSMATPHVSGVAALLIASGVAVTPDEIREVLQSTAEDKGPVGWDKEYGWGILDAAAALQSALPPNTPPVANVGGPYSGDEGQSIMFDGTQSYDAEDDQLVYRWDFGDGSVGSGSQPVHVYQAGGEYQVTLVVNDGREDSSPASTAASITEQNDAPVADVNGPYVGTEGELVLFDASGSYDPEGADLTYSWDFGDGSSGSGANPSHAYATSGVYTVSLTVNDGQLDSATVTTTASIDAVNLAPVAEVNGPYSGDEGEAVFFDASGSYDPEGADLTYSWDFGDGSSGSGANPSHAYATGGVYTVSLTVNDGQLDSTASITTATIDAVNLAPVAEVNGPYSGDEGEAVLFDASGSYDPEGADLTYSWDFGDGSSGSGANPSHAYATGGVYTVSLTVNDGQLDSTASTTTATIAALPNQDPVPTAGPDQEVFVSTPVIFDASSSYDPDGVIVSYAWDFGDGTTGSGESTSHTYALAGIYQVVLTVTDDEGASLTDSLQVTVDDPPPVSGDAMHVANIDIAWEYAFSPRIRIYRARAVVSVADENGQPLSGISIDGTWSGLVAGTSTAITDASGQAEFVSANVRRPPSGSLFEFTVTNLAAEGWTYDEPANLETSDAVAAP